ncbi:MAG: NosD domain-containing protein, partial [Candidatus Saccharimonadales bacterium]
VAGNPSGTLKWTESWLNTETHGVQVKNGYMSLQLGSITSLSSVDWNQDTLWLSINVGNTNTTCTPFTSCAGDGEMLPMKRLSSTPYAFNAGKLGGLSSAQFLQLAQGVQTEAANNTASIAINKTGTGGSFLNLQANSVDVFTVANTGDISFGNNIDHTIGVTTAAASTAGKSLTISAGTAGTGAGPLTGGTLVLQGGNGGGTGGNGGNVTLDAGAAASGGVGGTVNIGTTNASAIILGQNTTLSADKSLTITGSGTRPSSPTEGMVYFDTTTKQLITYSNGKWQSDRSTSTKIVAASNASQTLKDSADYVTDGTDDQTEINAALSAAAGGKVYLTEGTYTVSAAISVPNNTTLSGAGTGTVVTIANAFNTTVNAITNTTTGGNGTGIVIQSLKLDGNRANQTSGTMNGIYLNGAGSGTGASAVLGNKVANIVASNWSNVGIYLNASSNNILTSNTTQNNSNRGIYLNASSNNNTLTSNLSIGNAGYGFNINSSSNNTLTGNTSQGNGGSNFYINAASAAANGNTFTGNTSQGGSSNGFYVSGNMTYAVNNNTFAGNSVQNNLLPGFSFEMSHYNTIGSNKLSDNGGSVNNNALYFVDSDNNTVTGNSVTDSTATGTNYAINITDAASTSNYLANNTIGGGTINDLGGGTVWANQSRSTNGGQITNRTANSIESFVVQNASGSNLFAIDSTNNQVVVGNSSIAGKLVLSDGSSNTATITVAALAGNYTYTVPTTTADDTFCLVGLNNCAADSTLFIQNQNTAAQTTANFWISGTGQAATLTAATVNATTNLVTPTIDTASAVALTLGGATAGSVDIGKSAGVINLKANSTLVGTAAATGNITVQGAAQTVAATAGNQFILKGSTGNTTGAGGQLTLQGGDGGATSGANGGNVYIAGGTGTGTGVGGLVVITTPTFATATSDANCFTGGNPVAANCTITAASVNGSSAVLVGFSTSAKTAILPNPTISTAGRVIYVTASNTSEDFTLSVNGGGQGNQIAMRKNTTATMIWNGAAWTAAGASSSTTMQAAYDNTLQSAGGAELVVSKTSATNGFTIRDAVGATAVNGALLTVQSGSAANLFSVNSNVTEYATDPGAEVGGGGGGLTDNTFPVSTWTALTGTTLSRYTTAGDFIATGQGSVSAAIPAATANAGVANRLSTTLTPNMTYNVSFSTRLLSGTFTDMAVYYSVDGTAQSVTCATNETAKTSIWTKVNCAFQAPASGITANNAILIRQATGVIRTFYVDNLSVTIAADYNYATDGDVDDNTNFGTNWTYTTGTGTGTSTRNVSDGFNASSSATATITAGAANAGVRNKLAINPLTSTLYRVSIYAKAVTAFNDFKVRYSPDGGTSFVDCVDYKTQVVSTSTWTPITCYIKTVGTTVSNPYVYFVETASSARTYSVDAFSMTLASNTTPNVQVGSGSNGGPTTLFTVDKGASAPIAANNDALLGSMYYDTTLGKLQCYESDGWGACGSSPDNIVTISPEYTNAVMHGTGIGTMTSDLCSSTLNINDGTSSQPTICGTNETYNFYKWTSPQATAQTYSIYVTYQLPITFKEFASGSTSIMGRTDSASSTVQYQIYRSNSTSGMSACGSAVTVSTGVQTSWQPGQATGAADPSTCSFAGGDSVVFKISVTSSSNANAYVGNLGFTFSNR